MVCLRLLNSFKVHFVGVHWISSSTVAPIWSSRLPILGVWYKALETTLVAVLWRRYLSFFISLCFGKCVWTPARARKFSKFLISVISLLYGLHPTIIWGYSHWHTFSSMDYSVKFGPATFGVELSWVLHQFPSYTAVSVLTNGKRIWHSTSELYSSGAFFTPFCVWGFY